MGRLLAVAFVLVGSVAHAQVPDPWEHAGITLSNIEIEATDDPRIPYDVAIVRIDQLVNGFGFHAMIDHNRVFHSALSRLEADINIAEPMTWWFSIAGVGAFTITGPNGETRYSSGSYSGWVNGQRNPGFAWHQLPHSPPPLMLESGSYHIATRFFSHGYPGEDDIANFDMELRNPAVVPEPRTWMIVLAAACLLLFWRRRHRCSG